MSAMAPTLDGDKPPAKSISMSSFIKLVITYALTEGAVEYALPKAGEQATKWMADWFAGAGDDEAMVSTGVVKGVFENIEGVWQATGTMACAYSFEDWAARLTKFRAIARKRGVDVTNYPMPSRAIYAQMQAECDPTSLGKAAPSGVRLAAGAVLFGAGAFLTYKLLTK